ncbi:MAG: plastocyanin/azurin family copper-binding protein [Gelidibacter sp.]
MKKSFIIPSLAIVMFLGCSKKDSVEPESAPGSDIPGIEAIAITDEIQINASDDMAYDKILFKIKAAKQVKLNLKNIGKLPKEAMGHNVVIVNSETDINDFALEALKEKSNDYIPQSAEMKNNTIAFTKLLGPGESDQISFTPTEPAVYKFLCTFPGHHGTSHGQIVVVK